MPWPDVTDAIRDYPLTKHDVLVVPKTMTQAITAVAALLLGAVSLHSGQGLQGVLTPGRVLKRGLMDRFWHILLKDLLPRVASFSTE